LFYFIYFLLLFFLHNRVQNKNKEQNTSHTFKIVKNVWSRDLFNHTIHTNLFNKVYKIVEMYVMYAFLRKIKHTCMVFRLIVRMDYKIEHTLHTLITIHYMLL